MQQPDNETSVVIIGASSRRHKFANKAVRAFIDCGYTVHAVHPMETEVEGLPVYRTVADIPEEIQVASLYVSPNIGIDLLKEFRDKGIRAVYVNPGAGSPELFAEGEKLGLEMRAACSILAIGKSPAQYP